MIIIALFTSVVMFFLCYHSFEYIQTLYSRGRILPALGFEIWWIYLGADRLCHYGNSVLPHGHQELHQ